MRKRVPLNAIRAFEATARNSSVVRAADELCVTPTAVSHQLRLLEDFLQTELFIRRNARIELTAEARSSVAQISQALDLINDAVLTLAGESGAGRRRLTIAASASVTSLWLMPQISDFLKVEPEIDINVRTFLTRREAEAQEADIRIVNWQTTLDCRVDKLLEEEIIPLCAPAVLAAHDGDRRRVLEAAPLVHVDRVQDGFDGTYPDWGRYLAEAGISRSDVAHGPRFNTAGTAMEAAIAGVGVILGRSLLTARALARGELVPLAGAYGIRSPYYLLTPWKVDNNGAMQGCKDWLMGRGRERAMVPAA